MSIGFSGYYLANNPQFFSILNDRFLCCESILPIVGGSHIISSTAGRPGWRSYQICGVDSCKQAVEQFVQV